MADPVDDRRAEISQNLHEVRDRIDSTTIAAGRQPREVSLIVVTKNFPASDVAHLASLGVQDVGENRHQEGSVKSGEVDAELTWHFIGQLQRNKVAAVLGWADVIQSVDRLELAQEIVKRAPLRDRPIRVLIQISLDGSAGRAGAAPQDLSAIAAVLAGAPQVDLSGVMAVAPLDEDPRAAFERLSGIREGFLRDHPTATWCSAGMSNDYVEAIERGATHVRIGSSILGSRPPFG